MLLSGRAPTARERQSWFWRMRCRYFVRIKIIQNKLKDLVNRYRMFYVSMHAIPVFLKLEALELVDAATRKKLLKAHNTEEAEAVLDAPGVIWQTHARCLRHPMKAGGCPIPTNADLAAGTKRVLVLYPWLSFFPGKHANMKLIALEKSSSKGLGAQDISGSSCKDDSIQGDFKTDNGKDRKSALCHLKRGGIKLIKNSVRENPTNPIQSTACVFHVSNEAVSWPKPWTGGT